MNVLLVGGDGFVGSNLCRELVSRGHDVTVLSRTPDEGALPEEVETVTGDVTDYDSIEAAFEGRDAVVNLVALSPLFKPKGGDEMHLKVHLGGTENCVRAAAEHGVQRFVQMSGVGADPNGSTHFLRAKGRAEEVVRSSDLDWTIIRPTIVFGEGGEFVPFMRMVAPPYLTPLPGGGTMQYQAIWIEDFVPMLADALEDRRHVDQTYQIAGPEKLSLAEIARLVQGAKGRPVNVVPLPMPIAGIGLSILGAIPRSPMGADQYRSLKLDLTIDDNDVDVFGVDESELKTLEAYLFEEQ